MLHFSINATDINLEEIQEINETLSSETWFEASGILYHLMQKFRFSCVFYEWTVAVFSSLEWSQSHLTLGYYLLSGVSSSTAAAALADWSVVKDFPSTVPSAYLGVLAKESPSTNPGALAYLGALAKDLPSTDPGALACLVVLVKQGQTDRSKHDCPSMTLTGWCGR